MKAPKSGKKVAAAPFPQGKAGVSKKNAKVSLTASSLLTFDLEC